MRPTTTERRLATVGTGRAATRRSGNAMNRKARSSLPAIPTYLRIAVVIVLLCFSSGAALAGAQECMTSYYREKSPACIDDVLAQLRQMPPNARSEPSSIIGFLAQRFKASAPDRERILKAEPSDYVKSVYLVSLYRAGLPDEAQKFAAANNLSAVSEKLRAMRLAALDEVKPSSVPGDKDLLIGAYMASATQLSSSEFSTIIPVQTTVWPATAFASDS